MIVWRQTKRSPMRGTLNRIFLSYLDLGYPIATYLTSHTTPILCARNYNILGACVGEGDGSRGFYTRM